MRYTIDECKKDALLYETRTKWHDNSNFYRYASRKGWLDECCGHMPNYKARAYKHTLESCIVAARKYEYKIEWMRSDFNTYKAALKYDWLRECCGHMKKKLKYTIESVTEIASSCKNKLEWMKKDSGSYFAAKRLGIFDTCVKSFS